jgi:hypothetical protein
MPIYAFLRGGQQNLSLLTFPLLTDQSRQLGAALSASTRMNRALDLEPLEHFSRYPFALALADD